MEQQICDNKFFENENNLVITTLLKNNYELFKFVFKGCWKHRNLNKWELKSYLSYAWDFIRCCTKPLVRNIITLYQCRQKLSLFPYWEKESNFIGCWQIAIAMLNDDMLHCTMKFILELPFGYGKVLDLTSHSSDNSYSSVEEYEGILAPDEGSVDLMTL